MLIGYTGSTRTILEFHIQIAIFLIFRLYSRWYMTVVKTSLQSYSNVFWGPTSKSTSEIERRTNFHSTKKVCLIPWTNTYVEQTMKEVLVRGLFSACWNFRCIMYHYIWKGFYLLALSLLASWSLRESSKSPVLKLTVVDIGLALVWLFSLVIRSVPACNNKMTQILRGLLLQSTSHCRHFSSRESEKICKNKVYPLIFSSIALLYLLF